jgi:HEAT repeat protein
MKTENILTRSAGAARIPARRTVRMLLAVIGVIAATATPDHTIGKESSDAAIVSLSTPDSNLQGQNLHGLISALRKENAQDRQRAAISLGNMKNIQAVEPLIQSLKDDDDFVRNFAARALGNIGDSKALSPLIQALSDKHILVRCSAAQALGSLKDPRAVDPLINALESGDFLLQRAAAEALGRVGGPKAIDSLVKALRNEDIYIHSGASNALVRIGEPAISKLVAALAEEKLGAKAAEVLKEMNWQPSSDQERSRFDMALKKREIRAE